MEVAGYIMRTAQPFAVLAPSMPLEEARDFAFRRLGHEQGERTQRLSGSS